MNIWLIAVLSIFALLGVIYWVFFTGQGRKVQVLVYEKSKDGQAIQYFPNKVLYGYIIRKKTEVKFKLPKKVSKLAINPPTSEQLNYPQGSKYPTVCLLKISEDQFVYLGSQITNTNSLNLDVITKADWNTYIEESRIINETFKGVGDWLTKYGAMIVIGVIFLSGIITIQMVNQHSVELIEEHRGDALRQVEENRNLLERITETLNRGNPTNNNKEETDAVKPLGSS